MFQILAILFLFPANEGAELNSQVFSNAILNITTNLGAARMQHYYSSLVSTESPREVEDIADKLSGSLTQTFANAKNALLMLKDKVEASYNMKQFADDPLQCCNVTGLNPSYEFVAPVSKEFSCDRTSEISDSSAESLYGHLETVYKRNAQNSPSLRWQYFGSEYGIINQYPSSKAADCGSYDHRFRPWYIASATPKPKDVVLVIKNNIFADDDVRDKSFEAANIILRTLNPKDRLAVIMFNTKVTKLVSNGCYSNSLSLATPQNIAKLQYFLETRPSPVGGNDLLEALTTAFSYFVSQPAGNTTTQDKNRDRAVLLFTDGESLRTRSVILEVEDMIANLTTTLHAKMFAFASGDIPVDVTLFYQGITADPSTNSNLFTELPPTGDLRLEMARFYQSFSTSTDASNGDFQPVFLAPYYDLFGLDQLVLTLATPCHRDSSVLVGVAGVDLTVKDLLAAVEYFKEGEFSYAFVVDKEGITLFHPQLPEPSTNYTLVYLDISTLEPQNGFTEIRQSMISGLSDCKVINSTHVLPRGNKQSDGATTFVFPSSYCWRPIEGTPFSLCVVIPLNSARQGLNNLPPSSLDDYYHRIDVTASQLNLHLCQHAGSMATNVSSVVKLSPESFTQPENYLQDNETEAKVLMLQDVVADKSDPMQLFRIGVVDSIAATQEVNKIWISPSSQFTDHMVWKYIATSDGVLRIYPGIEVVPKDFNPILRPWYQRSVARLGSTAITSPYKDTFSGGQVVTVSRAILSESCSNLTNRSTNSVRSDPSCSVIAVMAVDFTIPSLWIVLQKSIPLCTDDRYKCFLVDDSGYVITHPDLFNFSYSRSPNIHLTQLEPYVTQDMLSLGYMRRVYCNNFQYNNDFTQRPRRQYSYELTDLVTKATSTIDGGSSNLCVFYKIAMVEGTNSIVIVLDIERSSFSRCKRLRCPCDPERPCGRLPSDCKCPCTENIPPENYNPCLESFTDLTAPACPVRFGNKNKDDVFGETTLAVDDSVPYCFDLNCTATDLVECNSRRGCSFCPVCTQLSDDCNSNELQCMPITACPSRPMKSPSVKPPSPSSEPVLQSSWTIIAAVFIVISSIALLVAIILLVAILLMKKHKRNTVLWNDDGSTKDGITTMSLNPISRSSISEDNSRSECTPSNGTTAQLLELSSKGVSMLTEFSTVTSHNAPSIDEEATSYSPSQVTSSPPTSGLGASNGMDTISELIDMRTHASGAGPLHSNSMASTVFTAGSYDPSQVGGIWF